VKDVNAFQATLFYLTSSNTTHSRPKRERACFVVSSCSSNSLRVLVVPLSGLSEITLDLQPSRAVVQEVLDTLDERQAG
jgi:hypothetical protein